MTLSWKSAATAAVVLLAGWALPVFAPAAPSDPAGILARRGGDDGEDGRRGRGRGGRRGGETIPIVIPAEPGAKALFEAKCSLCHPLSRPLRKSRERKWWVETVTRMQRVNGCPVTDEEAGAIIDYLAVVRGPGAPRGPDEDDHHEWGPGTPVPREEQGPGTAVPPAGGGDPDAKALFEAKCSICHPLSRPLGKTKDRAGWTEDVTRMQKVNGCPITDEEARAIIDYLVTIRGPAAR